LRHLANHTSGFPRFADNGDKKAFNVYKGYTEQMMYEFINSYSLTREPGSEFEYSAVGYGLLGQILSLKDQCDYETMITNRVLRPLGMTHTTISFTEQQMVNLVQGYYGKKHVESWSKEMQNIVQGAGALISTMDDQLIYLRANLGYIHSSLDDAFVLSHEFTFEHQGKYTEGIGLGWNHFTQDGQKVIWKNGGNGGYNSFIGFTPENKEGVVVLINSSLNPEIFATDIGMHILRSLQRF
jgi:CubicO group peptidase (beta-lactamase class C family)